MRSTTNKQRLTNMLKGIQKSIDLFPSQGHTDVYFSAQFLRGGKKQNGIERGDIDAFANQIRTYVSSEEADAVRIAFIDDATGKSIYSKMLTGLQATGEDKEPVREVAMVQHAGLGGYMGLGEAQVNNLIEKKVAEVRMQDEYQRMAAELDEIRGKYTALEQENETLEATLKAKKDTEYYMGIIGAAFPGLATLFTGTPLAQAAGFLAGTSDLNGNTIATEKETADSDRQSISAMVAEFCDTLSLQEASTVHLLFMAFEKDRALLPRALHFITTQTPTQ